MRGLRTPWLRGVLTLGVLSVFGAGMLISNVAAVSEGKEASKKFVRQFVKKRIGKSETTILNQTIAEDELIRVTRQVNQNGTDHELGTFGPFSFIGHCDDDGANFDASIEIQTSEANSIADTDWESEEDFDPNDSNAPVDWLRIDDVPDADPQNQYGGSNEMRVSSPSGTHLQGFASLLTNFDGFDCTFAFTIIQVAPTT